MFSSFYQPTIRISIDCKTRPVISFLTRKFRASKHFWRWRDDCIQRQTFFSTIHAGEPDKLRHNHGRKCLDRADSANACVLNFNIPGQGTETLYNMYLDPFHLYFVGFSFCQKCVSFRVLGTKNETSFFACVWPARVTFCKSGEVTDRTKQTRGKGSQGRERKKRSSFFPANLV